MKSAIIHTKHVISWALASCIAATAFGQTKGGSGGSPATPQQPPALIPGRELRINCDHLKGNPTSPAPTAPISQILDPSRQGTSQILYQAKVLDATKLSGLRIHVGQLTAIIVHFDDVNTFCWDYQAGITNEVAFYGNGMPSPLKTFFVGPLPVPFAPRGGAGKPSDDFLKAENKFDTDYAAYVDLGAVAANVTNAFRTDIKSNETNAVICQQLNTDIKLAMNISVGDDGKLTPDADKRKLTRADFTLRQTELLDGVKLLTHDLEALRSAALPEDLEDPVHKPNLAAQKRHLAKDEDNLGSLSGQCDNYAIAIDNLEEMQAAKPYIERTIYPPAGYDEYVITASVALLNPHPTDPDSPTTLVSQAGSPVASPSASGKGQPPTQGQDASSAPQSVTVDITGGSQIDYGIGIVATHPVSHNYYLFPAASGANMGKNVITDGGARDPAFVPAAFVSLYRRPAPGQFAFGPAFGLDLSSLGEYFFGAAITRAGPQRFALVGGFSLSQTKVLNGDVIGKPPTGMNIQYKNIYSGGYFVGLTFNLGG